jgi:uncharacterized protein with von Willebrand factor type A (vWA) domain
MPYRRRAHLIYAVLRRKWNPPRYGLCPKCEHERIEKMKEKGIKPPKMPRPEDPPEWTEIRPPKRGKPGRGEGKKEEQKEEQRGRAEKEEERQRGERKGEERADAGRGKGEEEDPLGFSPEDIEKAREGTEEVKKEFKKAQQIKTDKTTPMFKPVIGVGAASGYRDQNFISKMRTAMKEWKVGYAEKTGKYGARLKVKEYIKSRGKRPFLTRIRKTAKGRKIFVVADFSGSITPFQEHYKKALVSALEVMDSVGVKTALFGFGGERGTSRFFFKIKKFEDPRWTMNHASKVAVLVGAGSTPTATAYSGIEKYVRMHRPDITITLTDGEPTDGKAATEHMVKRLKRYTRMVAFGIGEYRDSAKQMENTLKGFGYDKVFAVSTQEMNNLPKKLVDLIAPT